MFIFDQVYEVPDDADVDQESDNDIQFIHSNDKPGYNEARTDDVRDLLTYFEPPKVSQSLSTFSFLLL